MKKILITLSILGTLTPGILNATESGKPDSGLFSIADNQSPFFYLDGGNPYPTSYRNNITGDPINSSEDIPNNDLIFGNNSFPFVYYGYIPYPCDNDADIGIPRPNTPFLGTNPSNIANNNPPIANNYQTTDDEGAISNNSFNYNNENIISDNTSQPISGDELNDNSSSIDLPIANNNPNPEVIENTPHPLRVFGNKVKNFFTDLFTPTESVRCKNIYQAAHYGDLEALHSFVQQGADVNAPGPSNGETLMHIAASGGYVHIMQYLRDQGANGEILNNDNLPPIVLAACLGHLDAVKFLHDWIYADNAAKYEFVSLATEKAAGLGYLPIVKYLIEKHPSNFVVENWLNTLNSAGMNGHLDVFAYLTEIFYAHFDSLNKFGHTVLISSAMRGQLEIVKYLCENCRINIEAKDIDGRTALNAAACLNKLDIVRYLCEKCDANLDTRDKAGKTPIENARPRSAVWNYLTQLEQMRLAMQPDVDDGTFD